MNTCCQCGSAGAVANKYLPKPSGEVNDPIPIMWVCAVCGRHVCINCALTIPGTDPIELTDDTLCSEDCQQILPPRASSRHTIRRAKDTPSDSAGEYVQDTADRIFFGKDAAFGVVGASPFDAVLVLGCYEATNGKDYRMQAAAAYREAKRHPAVRARVLQELGRIVADLQAESSEASPEDV